MSLKSLVLSTAIAAGSAALYNQATYGVYAEPPHRSLYEKVREPVEVAVSEVLGPVIKYQALPTAPFHRGVLGLGTLCGLVGVGGSMANLALRRSRRRTP
ncbi:MAG TPA: hypothetical protein VFE88_03100 [Candidatus Nanoarchaeia archaeon]|nr:hypothetical protein [Candidatus Nanoarchaeia archaeon]